MGDSFLVDATGRAGLLTPDELDLPAPERGDRLLRHDPEFVALDAGLSRARDTVNLGIRALNELGAGLRELPDGSLEELLIQPLTGDYPAIRQNAEACHQVGRALATYAGNVHRLSLAVDPRWGGRAASSYLLRLNAHALAARGLGVLVDEGAVVFDEIAELSERLTIEVEGLVVELAETAGRLARRILQRVAGPLGWGTFAAELAVKGWDAFLDIVRDVERVIEIIDYLLQLQADLTTWVEEWQQRLEVLRGLPELIGGGGGGGGGSL